MTGKRNKLWYTEGSPHMPAMSLDVIEFRDSIVHATAGDLAERVINHPAPERLIRSLCPQDLYWLIQRVGADDSLCFIEAASAEQWQFIVDLEIWDGDRIDIKKSTEWLLRFKRSDEKRFISWLYDEMWGFTLAYFYRLLHWELLFEEVRDDLDKGAVSPDGTLYVTVTDDELAEPVMELVSALFTDEHRRYVMLFDNLSVMIPAEIEEEVYRMRNVRIAEEGFLPREEAVSVYAPLDVDVLKKVTVKKMARSERGVGDTAVPAVPLALPAGTGFLWDVIAAIDDTEVVDRLRREFAGLCNRLIVADGLVPSGYGTLRDIGNKAARCISIAVEAVSGGDHEMTHAIIFSNSLDVLFRVGYGHMLQFRRDVRSWRKDAWFARRGFPLFFWGDEWSAVVNGVIADTSRDAAAGDDDIMFGCETYADVEKIRTVFAHMTMLDVLLERMDRSYDLGTNTIGGDDATVHSLLFTFWVRRMLGLSPVMASVAYEDVRECIKRIRKDPVAAETMFLKTFCDDMVDEPNIDLLRDALHALWVVFDDAYRTVAPEDINDVYHPFFLVDPAVGEVGK